MEADALALLLARIQFAFTISFHFIFPSFSIGLASFLAVLEWRWLTTGQQMFLDLFKYWLKIFAIAFAMGVVSAASSCPTSSAPTGRSSRTGPGRWSAR